MTTLRAVTQPSLSNMEPAYAGKVREVYDLGDTYLIVASDRISAFDVIMPTGIAGKGIILTQMSKFWFDYLGDSFENHIISFDVDAIDAIVPDDKDLMRGRVMHCRKVDIVPIECIVRGYLTGSGIKSYRKDGTVCGITLPEGLTESSKLPETIFTPTTKAAEGHDEDISFAQCVAQIGEDKANWLRETAIAIYEKGREYAATKGIILCDTKFEFGALPDGKMILADEVLTPDSSRFWLGDTYQEGVPQDSYDKQILRIYLETLDWAKEPPGPELPSDIVQKIRDRYFDCYKIIAGDAAAAELESLLAPYQI